MIHNIDECCWMKDAWPVEAKAIGGRHYRGDMRRSELRQLRRRIHVRRRREAVPRRPQRCPAATTNSPATPTARKGSAIISTASHSPAKCQIYKGQTIGKKDQLQWSCMPQEPNPYQTEWDDLVEAIRKDKPYNEAKRGIEASLVTSMGRMAAHTGQVVTFDDMLNCSHEFAPGLDKLTLDGPAPIQAGPDGRYPVPQPGITTKREYA